MYYMYDLGQALKTEKPPGTDPERLSLSSVETCFLTRETGLVVEVEELFAVAVIQHVAVKNTRDVLFDFDIVVRGFFAEAICSPLAVSCKLFFHE